MRFEPDERLARCVPHVLKVAGDQGDAPRFLRLTHNFGGLYYAIDVTDARACRYARRPYALTLSELQAKEADGGVWGRLALPNDFTQVEDGAPSPAEGAWRIIEPIVKDFESEKNLKSRQFSKRILERATQTQVSQQTVLRLVLRYFYFGRAREALVPLISGAKPKPIEALPDRALASIEGAEGSFGRPTAKRRGRQPSVSEKIGRNEFIVSTLDIADMVYRYETMGAAGRTTAKAAHEKYIEIDFKKRHPGVFAAYERGDHPLPVTLRQYYGYTGEHARINKDIARNIKTKGTKRTQSHTLDILGPGDLYEIDATGGRIVLTTSGQNRRLLAKPTIYVVIDRWSRYIVSIYISLKAPAWDEVRYAVLIAFTSRKKRFSALKVDIDDQRWPVGCIPSLIRRDRGTDMISGSMDQAVSGDLRIDPNTLPSLTPNGKAIVERFIRTLKQKMAQRLKGAYADGAFDLHSRRAQKNAREVAVHSLAEAYRILIEIVVEYNNAPHTHLKKMTILQQNGVPPTPQAAYLWGIKKITGRRVSSFSDDNIQQMMLGVDKASIAEGIVLYKSRQYRADNAVAIRYAATSTNRRKSIDVRVDKTFPYEILVPTRNGPACFSMVASDKRALGIATLDEVDVLKPGANANTRLLEHQQQHERITGIKAKKQNPSIDRSPMSPQQLADERQSETAALKAALTGKPVAASPARQSAKPTVNSAVPEWKRRQQSIREANIDRIAKHREEK